MLGQRRRRWANSETIVIQRLVFAGHVDSLAETGFSSNGGLMLAQRRRRWTSIKPILTHNKRYTLYQFCISVGPALQTVGQH